VPEPVEKVFVHVVRKRGGDRSLLAFDSHNESDCEVPKKAAERSGSPIGTAYRELQEKAGLGEAALLYCRGKSVATAGVMRPKGSSWWNFNKVQLGASDIGHGTRAGCRSCPTLPMAGL